MPKLTKRMIEKLEPEDKDYCVADSELPGFGIRVLPSGRKSVILQYRASRTKVRKKTLGMFGILSVEEARKKAFAMLTELQLGTDPVAAEKQEKVQKLTMSDLIKRFIEEHVDVHLKPKTPWGYKRNIKRNILSALGKVAIADITKADIGAFHHKMRYAPYEANRCLAILSAMFNKAELWGLRIDNSNPCKHIKKYKEQK